MRRAGKLRRGCNGNTDPLFLSMSPRSSPRIAPSCCRGCCRMGALSACLAPSSPSAKARLLQASRCLQPAFSLVNFFFRRFSSQIVETAEAVAPSVKPHRSPFAFVLTRPRSLDDLFSDCPDFRKCGPQLVSELDHTLHLGFASIPRQRLLAACRCQFSGLPILPVAWTTRTFQRVKRKIRL